MQMIMAAAFIRAVINPGAGGWLPPSSCYDEGLTRATAVVVVPTIPLKGLALMSEGP